MMTPTCSSCITGNATIVIPPLEKFLNTPQRQVSDLNHLGKKSATRLLIVLAAAGLFAGPVLAGLPMIGDDEIPERLTAAEEDGIHVFSRISLDEHWFDEFSGGGSDDLSPAATDRLRALVDDLQSNQWIFVQATADKMRWHGRRSKEAHRLNTSLAIARALWGRDHLKRERVSTLSPRLGAERRGLSVLIATYDEQIVPYPSAEPPPEPPPVVIREVQPAPPSFAIGLEGGMGLIRTRGITMTTPTVDLVIAKEEVRLDVGVGWAPAGEEDLGDVAQVWGLDCDLQIGYARVTVDELDVPDRWANALVFGAQIGKVF
jgi:hypothetical protein